VRFNGNGNVFALDLKFLDLNALRDLYFEGQRKSSRTESYIILDIAYIAFGERFLAPF